MEREGSWHWDIVGGGVRDVGWGATLRRRNEVQAKGVLCTAGGAQRRDGRGERDALRWSTLTAKLLRDDCYRCPQWRISDSRERIKLERISINAGQLRQLPRVLRFRETPDYFSGATSSSEFISERQGRQRETFKRCKKFFKSAGRCCFTFIYRFVIFSSQRIVEFQSFVWINFNAFLYWSLSSFSRILIKMRIIFFKTPVFQQSKM